MATFSDWLIENDFCRPGEENELSAKARDKLHALYSADSGIAGADGPEVDRIRTIRATRNEYVNRAPDAGVKSQIAALAIEAAENGWPAVKYELESFKVSSPSGASNVPTGYAGGSISRDVLSASLMLRVGNHDLAVKTYGERAVQAAEKSGINCLEDLCRAALRMDPQRAHQANDGRDRMIKAAFSTIALPTILSDVMGKTLEMAYTELVGDIRSFATVKSAANFKPQTAIRPSSIESLEQLGPAGEIKHSDIKEEDTYPWQLGTFARMVGITRTDIVNDDLGFFGDVPAMLATAAARALLDLFWETIINGETAGHFSVGNGNLYGSGSALAIGSLATGVQIFREQVDSRGNNISIVPRVLAVSPKNEATARALLNSTEIVAVTNTTTPSGNPVRGIVDRLVVEARLSNDTKFANADEAEWFLFGGPSSAAVLLGFLNGRQSPVVESEDAPFNTLGIQVRAYHDFAVALGDHRAALKATGAA